MNALRSIAINRKSRAGFALLLVFILTIGLAAIIMVLYSSAGNPFSAWEGTEKDRYSDPNAVAGGAFNMGRNVRGLRDERQASSFPLAAEGYG